jgi:hypothetical protein
MIRNVRSNFALAALMLITFVIAPVSSATANCIEFVLLGGPDRPARGGLRALAPGVAAALPDDADQTESQQHACAGFGNVDEAFTATAREALHVNADAEFTAGELGQYC